MGIPLLMIASLVTGAAPADESASVVARVRGQVAAHQWEAARATLATAAAGPSRLEAWSWLARGELAAKQMKGALATAREVQRESEAMLTSLKLDDEVHLPIALGAALEVQAQALASTGDRLEAIELLEAGLRRYGTSSIAVRLQKNLNLLTLEGKAAPELGATAFVGPKAPTLAELKGKPVLLFFWAHWCSTCKQMAAALAVMPSGLQVLMPTQLYGTQAEGAPATPPQELAHIARVLKAGFPTLTAARVPLSEAAFRAYGVSTTPTLVLVDRSGRVVLYHPGPLSEAELQAAVKQVLAAGP